MKNKQIDNIFDKWLANTPIAHRGLHTKDAPENTLAAFSNAIDKGYAIEIDVREIDDGTVIVFHDDRLSRLTDKDGYACNLKPHELCERRIMGTMHTIPTLAETLELVCGKVPLLIEIKNSGKVGALERKVLNLLNNYKGEFAIQSFNPYSVEYFYKNAPHIIRGQLACFFTGEKMGIIKKFLLKRLSFAHMNKPHFIAYQGGNLPNKYVRKHSDLPLLAWTVRSQEDYKRVAPHCTNIIFENFIPEIIKK